MADNHSPIELARGARFFFVETYTGKTPLAEQAISGAILLCSMEVVRMAILAPDEAFFSSGHVMKARNVTRSQAIYAIEKAGLEPDMVVGLHRFYSRDKWDAVIDSLRKMDQRNAAGIGRPRKLMATIPPAAPAGPMPATSEPEGTGAGFDQMDTLAGIADHYRLPLEAVKTAARRLKLRPVKRLAQKVGLFDLRQIAAILGHIANANVQPPQLFTKAA